MFMASDVKMLEAPATNFADFVDLGTIVHQELAMLRHRGLGSLVRWLWYCTFSYYFIISDDYIWFTTILPLLELCS